MVDGKGEPALAQLVAVQRGVVSRPQLKALGFTDNQIAHRVRCRRLHRIHRGVYAVGHPVLPPLGRETAALLACGPRAVLSHRTAAALLHLLPFRDGPVDVTVPRIGSRSHAGIRVHRAARLDPGEMTRRHGLPLTALFRALVDLPEVATAADTEQAIAEAERRRIIRREDVRAYLATAHGRRGVRVVSAILDQDGGPAFTRSPPERTLLGLIRAARLPTPQVNTVEAGHEVDFLWPRHGLVVELDSYAWHSSPEAFERDHRRDGDLDDHGHRVLRFTARQLQRDPHYVVARIAGALAARAAA